MLNRIIGFSIRNKLIIGIAVLGMAAWGINSLYHLPIDAVPDITNNQVQLITRAPSQAAQDIERLVTFPVEQGMATIPGLVELRSFSRFGLSVVTLVFTEETDVYWARQQVEERLNGIQLPQGVNPPEMAPVSTGLGEIYQYILKVDPEYRDRYDIMELRSIQDWIVRRNLLGTPGVADVSSFGGYVKQYEIAVDPSRLLSYGLSLPDVMLALEKNNANTGSGYIEKNAQAWYIRSEGLITNLEDIRNIPLKTLNTSGILRIRDVAEVGFGHAVRYGALTNDSIGETVGGIVMMLKGENSYQVVENVRSRMSGIQQSLPPGVRIESYLDRSELIDRAINTVKTNLLEGALIVIFVLVLFLGNLRAGLIVATVIPLSLLFAVSMMNLFGVSGNLMSLGAIDFGLVVDGSVIIVEATLHHLALRRGAGRLSQAEMDEEVYLSSSRIRTAAAFGEIIILIVYLPILTLTGVEGKMFTPMAQTVSFAIIGAFLLSLTYVPMMSALLLSKKKGGKDFTEKWLDKLKSLFLPALKWVLRRGIMIPALAFVALGGIILLFNQMGSEFLPTLDEGDFAVEMRAMPGTGLEENVNYTLRASEIALREFPDEVVKVVGKLGTSEIPTDPMPLEATDLMIILKPRDQWTQARDREELADKMQQALSVIPGVSFGFQQPIQMRFNELMTGVKQDVAVKLFGEDLDELDRLAGKIHTLVNKVDGATDIYREEVTGMQQLIIRPDREALARFGVNLSELNAGIQASVAGSSAGFVYEGEKRFDLVVRLDSQHRMNPTDLRNLRIPSQNGELIPLAQLASVKMEANPLQIQREGTQRRILVAFNVRGRDVGSVVEELQSEINTNLNLPSGYFVQYGGQFENLREANDRLIVAVPIALAFILLLLYFTFHSVGQALLIFSAIPLAAIGGVLALWIRDMPFSISAGVGFIALFGVAVLNGIVLIAAYNRYRKSYTLVRSVLFGTLERIRPVLMTATVASLGFLPMALSDSAGAEVQKPLATVVIGGLISSTFLTLFVLPVLYHITQKKLRHEKL